jgi:RNA polymerase sigma-70 factor (family 1)
MDRHQFDEQYYLQLFIAGDEDAFNAIFKRYYTGLLNFAKVLIPYPSDEAEDVLAEMFFHLWHNRRKIVVNTTLGAYLYVAVRNRVYDHYRKRKTLFSLPDDAMPEAPAEGYLQPDHLLMYKDAASRIRQLVTELPPQMRLVFTLHRDEGFSYEEISGLLNISVNSVKTHMFRAVKMLRNAWPIPAEN